VSNIVSIRVVVVGEIVVTVVSGSGVKTGVRSNSGIETVVLSVGGRTTTGSVVVVVLLIGEITIVLVVVVGGNDVLVVLVVLVVVVGTVGSKTIASALVLGPYKQEPLPTPAHGPFIA
jgi:hypothetical protein